MQRAVKAAVIIFITLAVLAFLTNQLMNRVFYIPYRDYDTKAKVFYLGVQTLTPLKEDAFYMAHIALGRPLSMAETLSKFPLQLEENTCELVGIINSLTSKKKRH